MYVSKAAASGESRCVPAIARVGARRIGLADFVDGQGQHAIRVLDEGGRLSGEDAGKLATFVAGLCVRTPAFREQHRQLAEQMRDPLIPRRCRSRGRAVARVAPGGAATPRRWWRAGRRAPGNIQRNPRRATPVSQRLRKDDGRSGSDARGCHTRAAVVHRIRAAREGVRHLRRAGYHHAPAKSQPAYRVGLTTP